MDDTFKWNAIKAKIIPKNSCISICFPSVAPKDPLLLCRRESMISFILKMLMN
jgi:hypothetical protein